MLSARLKIYREKCALTQRQLAALLNLDRSTYSYYETGKSQPSLTTIGKLAKIFGVTVDELLDDSPATDAMLLSNPSTRYGSPKRMVTSLSVLTESEQDWVLQLRLMPAAVRDKLLTDTRALYASNIKTDNTKGRKAPRKYT